MELVNGHIAEGRERIDATDLKTHCTMVKVQVLKLKEKTDYVQS